jgi:ribosomal silencing factor RsfS
MELTIGDLRYINESANSFIMETNMESGKYKEIQQDLKDHIEELKTGFVKEFGEYFRREREAGSTKDADGLLYDFDEIFGEEHPEFYDMEKLFEGCERKEDG